MAVVITCDTCRQVVPRGSGWRVTPISNHPTEFGDPTGDYCSSVCMAQMLNRQRGVRPNFAAARLRLQDQVDEILDAARP